MYKVKFNLYLNPSNIKKIALWPTGFGILMLILTVFPYLLTRYFPLEISLLYIQIIDFSIAIHFLLLSIIFLITGYILDLLGWRNGVLILKDSSLEIKGSKQVNLNYIDILRFKYEGSKSIQVRSRSNPVSIKFKSAKDKQAVFALLENKTEGAMQPAF